MTKKKDIELRPIMGLPRIDDFYNMLYDRIFMQLSDFFLEKPFTFFLLALPRNNAFGHVEYISRFTTPLPLKYVGLQRQRELLTSTFKKKSPSSLEKDWETLNSIIINTAPPKIIEETEVNVSNEGKLFQLPNGSIELHYNHLPVDDLKKAESNILSFWIDNLNEYHYISLPLIQFGEIDGMVNIVFHSDDLNGQFSNLTKGSAENRSIKKILKLIIREYEEILLDWQVEEGNYDFKKNTILRVTDPSFDEEFFKRLEENPILKELDLKEHYELHKPYYQQRYDIADKIPERMHQQFRLNAILAIIIDSYAHNISAHSLTSLEWLFRQRSLQDSNTGKINIKSQQFDRLILNEMPALIRYLQDKGTFWTSSYREHGFGGKISSLYSILWYGFGQNSLILGSIAASENIFKLNIKISIVKTIENQYDVLFKKEKIYSGHFFSIDLKALYDSVESGKTKTFHQLVEKGSEFELLKKPLKKINAFFPSSIVGQHAFYTILENELRNVKHYQYAAIEEMRRNGLTLHISIEEQIMNHQEHADQYPYYLIGIWLEHLTIIDQQVLSRRLALINNDIVDPYTSRVRLGGAAQDKICAAFLFNNSFQSVEQIKTSRDKQYYPWVQLGSSPKNDKNSIWFEESIISARQYFSEDHPEKKAIINESYSISNLGYFKKFFYLWKGAEVYNIKNIKNIAADLENIARFRFVSIENITDQNRSYVREKGIVRVIDSATSELSVAYEIWLKEWLYPLTHFQIQFYIQSDFAAIIEWKNDSIKFYNKEQGKKNQINFLNPQSENVQIINLAHGQGYANNEYVKYRSHGVFIQYFLDNEHIVRGNMSNELTSELFEVLASNLLIFDNRIAHRLEEVNPSILIEQLKCWPCRESVDLWQEQKAIGLDRFHIIVLHLSFIEAFIDENGMKKYSEENIKEFIDEEILSNPKFKNKRNFLLIITTGRGRTQWWDKLNAEKDHDYTAFVIFRPVEAILSAIEDALSISDDIELKYRLVKVLFGS